MAWSGSRSACRAVGAKRLRLPLQQRLRRSSAQQGRLQRKPLPDLACIAASGDTSLPLKCNSKSHESLDGRNMLVAVPTGSGP